MTKTKQLLAFVLSFVAIISTLFAFSFVIGNETPVDFRSALTNIYQKYDENIDRAELDKNEFALSRLVVLDYDGESYGAVDSAIDSRNNFAVLQYDSPASAQKAYESIKSKGLVVDADGYAELNAYELGDMYPVASDLLGTKKYVNSFEMDKDDVLVAVIDTGMMLDHPDIKNRLYNRGYDMSSDGCSDADYNKQMNDRFYFHSTFVAGIIANNTPSNVKIVPYKVMPFGAGDIEASAMVAAVNDAIELGVDVINLSVSTYSARDVLQTLVKRATQAGICICASAGNKGAPVDSCPAVFDETITVGALNKNCDKVASFSSYGSTVDFVAPGSHVISSVPTENGAGYGEYSGTSFSTPYITALCADIKMMDKNLSRNDVYNVLSDCSIDMGDEGKDDYYGNGVPDISNIIYTDNESYTYRLPQGVLDVYARKDYTASTQPWSVFASKIKTVNVDTDLTEIGAYNFYGMSNAQFNFGKLDYVGEYAFNGCKTLPDITFDIDVVDVKRGAFGNIRNNYVISGYKNTPAELYALSEQILFDPLGCNHNYVFEIVEPYGDNDGYTIYTCVVCDDSYIGEYIEPMIVASGKCGDNVTYSLYNTGKLEISGSGEMYSYADEQSPFYSFRNDVTKIFFDGDISYVSPFALSCCRYVKYFYTYTDSVKIIDNSVYSGDGKTLFYAFGSDYEMPSTVENFNASAFINSVPSTNNNFTVEKNIVYDADANIVMAMPSYNENVLTINDDISINDYAFILTEYPSSLRCFSEDATFGDYAIGYSYDNSLYKNNFSYNGYDTSLGFKYAVDNGFTANSLNSGVCGDEMTWKFNIDTKELRIDGRGKMWEFKNPNNVPWIDYNDEMESIYISDDIDSLSVYSFFVNNNVKQITVPASLQIVKSVTVWYGCKNVESFVINPGNGIMPNYGDTIKASTFTYSPWYHSREHIKSIVFNDGVKNIGKFAFRNCSNIECIEMNDCDNIGDYAFFNAYNLKHFVIRNKNTLFGKNCFFSVCDGFVLAGYNDSTVYDFAIENGIAFDSIGCGHSRGYTCNGEKAVCCYDSEVEYKCVDCNELIYDEYIVSSGDGHFVKADVCNMKGNAISNAEVYFDGTLCALTNTNGRFVVDKVKCDIDHLIEIKKNGVVFAKAFVRTDGANRLGCIRGNYGNFVCDNVINGKDYAFAMKNGYDDLDLIDYGRIDCDYTNNVMTMYKIQSEPVIYSVYNEANADKAYRRDFIAETNFGKDYIFKEAGFLYGKNMDDDFMVIENAGMYCNGYQLKKSAKTEYDYQVFKFAYGSASMDGKISARFYFVYSNGVKDYVVYSNVTSYEY